MHSLSLTYFIFALSLTQTGPSATTKWTQQMGHDNLRADKLTIYYIVTALTMSIIALQVLSHPCTVEAVELFCLLFCPTPCRESVADVVNPFAPSFFPPTGSDLAVWCCEKL
ncbi:hypothetical protein BsWGS_18995 [Bradybaena similaris]